MKKKTVIFYHHDQALAKKTNWKMKKATSLTKGNNLYLKLSSTL